MEENIQRAEQQLLKTYNRCMTLRAMPILTFFLALVFRDLVIIIQDFRKQ